MSKFNDNPTESQKTEALNRTLSLFGFLTAVCFWLLFTPPVSAQPAPPPDPQILNVDSTGLTLRWELPDYQLHITSDQTATLTVPNWNSTALPGVIALPSAHAWIVLPPTGTARLETRIIARETLTLSTPLAVNPQELTPLRFPQPGFAVDLPPQLQQPPPSGVTLTEIGTLRGIRLARLDFYPFNYSPDTRRLDILRAVEIQLRFSHPTSPIAPPPPSDELLQSLKTLTLNPEALSAYTASPPAVASPARITPTWQFTLTTPGLYALPAATLSTAGLLPAGYDPALLHLSHADHELALQWNAAAAQWRFYAAPQPTRWSTGDTYRLTYGGTPAPQMATRSGNPTGLPTAQPTTTFFREENRAYDSLFPAYRDGDHWYWLCLERPASAPCPLGTTIPLTLETPLTNSTPAILTLWLQGYTGMAAHRLSILINGSSLGSFEWNGTAPYTATLPLPTALLRAGTNSLSITTQLTGGIWMDALALSYPLNGRQTATSVTFSGNATPSAYPLTGFDASALIYDITDPTTPQMVTGATVNPLKIGDDGPGPHTYWVATANAITTITNIQPLRLLNEPAGADYLVLAPEAFIPTLQPLLNLRTAQGLTPVVVSVEAVYDQYGEGRMDPEALRRFVAHAYTTWNPRPQYLLLIGDGTWDPLNHLATGVRTWLPPYLASADPWMGETAADNRYAAVDGPDFIPDLALGRLPVNSTTDLQAVIDKIIAYETNPWPGDWTRRHLFVVDNTDEAGDFSSAATAVIARIPTTHTTTRLLCPATGDIAPTRAALLQAWSQSALIVNWIGHSSYQQWEHRRLFHLDDMPILNNPRRLPFVVEMTCYTGNFAHPVPLQSGLDETLVRRPQTGAVAAWGSSGGGLGDDHTLLHDDLYRLLLQNPAPALGPATTLARAAQAGTLGSYLMDTYNLLGDPATHLAARYQPWNNWIYLPGIQKKALTRY